MCIEWYFKYLECYMFKTPTQRLGDSIIKTGLWWCVVHRVYRTHVEQTFYTCTWSARCSKSLTHSNQCMRHKYMPSWQMASLEGKSHQELTPSMQYTHCRQITNQIIAAVFKKHKYWAALITYYLISLPVLVHAKQIPFGSNEGRISVPHTCWNTPQPQKGTKGSELRFIV